MKIEKAITVLRAYERNRHEGGPAIRAQLLVAIAYIVIVLTVPLLSPGTLVWLLCYPIVMSEALGVGYGRILVRSLWVLPLIVLIGIFNPIYDHTPMWDVYGVVVSRGWVMFIGVTLRGLLSVQALLLLTATSGFEGICRALAAMHVPAVLVTQLMMLYRYLIVLLDEALAMHRSRVSRGFGRKSYPLGMWGVMVGQLLMRSIRRSQRVSRAMLARGFEGGVLRYAPLPPMRPADYAYIFLWLAILLAIRMAL